MPRAISIRSIARTANAPGGRRAAAQQLRAAGYTTAQTRNIIRASTNPRGNIARGRQISTRSAQRIMRTGSSGG